MGSSSNKMRRLLMISLSDLARAETRTHGLDGFGCNQQVQRERVVRHVIQVVAEFDARGVSAVSIALLHLGPASQAWAHEMAVGVAGDGGGKVAHKRGLLGARANQAHVAHEHVEELWQFV